MPGTPVQPSRFICDACRRDVDYVRGSMWHGAHRICRECFCEWYDASSNSFDPCNPIELGNYVRSKHGLPPLEQTPG